MTTAPPVLETRKLSKSYGPIQALRDIDFAVNAGEVIALCGDNGAGKSTFVKALSGTGPADAGEILFDGRPVRIGSPHVATELGIATVYQDLALCDNLDIVSNLFLGREIARRPFFGRLRRLRTPEMMRIADQTLGQLAMTLPALTTPISALSGGQRQGIAVGRAIVWGSRVVLLDEPTAALGVEQTQNVLEMIRRLAAKGLGVVVISHSLPDVFAVSDRVAVLRLGQLAGTFETASTTPEQVVAAITGAAVQEGMR
jgi:D-xylose transport system ATP-binding protein